MAQLSHGKAPDDLVLERARRPARDLLRRALVLDGVDPKELLHEPPDRGGGVLQTATATRQ